MSKNLYKAFLKFQSELKPVQKDAKNPHFRNDYTTLLSVTEHLKEPLSAAGLIILQYTFVVDAKPYLKTLLIHSESGEMIEDAMPILCADSKPQSFGSALSYAKRYAKMTITGLTDTLEDDDAEKATGRYQNPTQSQPERKKTIPAELEYKIKTVEAHDDFVAHSPTKATKEVRSVPVAEIVKLTSFVKSKGRTEAWLAMTVKKEFNLTKLTNLTIEQIEKIKGMA